MIKHTFFDRENFIPHSAVLLFYCFFLLFILYVPVLWDKFAEEGDEQAICIAAFADVVSEDLLTKFEEETGIKVKAKWCETDAEMYIQMHLNSGSGYDVVFPTDYMVKIMNEQNLIDPINIAELSDYQNLEPHFRKHSHKKPDGGIVNIPMAWTLYGLGFKKSYFDNKGLKRPDSLAYVFTPDRVFPAATLATRLAKYRVCIIDNPQELMFLTSVFAFGEVHNFTPERIETICDILKKQRKWLQAYTDSDVGYYLQHCVPVLVAYAAHIKRTVDADDRFSFVLPKEGSLLVLQHCCIPRGSKNKTMALEFIKFMLNAKNQAQNFDDTGCSPTNALAKDLIDEKFSKDPNFFPDASIMEHMHQINTCLTTKQTDEMLLQIKST